METLHFGSPEFGKKSNFLITCEALWTENVKYEQFIKKRVIMKSKYIVSVIGFNYVRNYIKKLVYVYFVTVSSCKDFFFLKTKKKI